MTLSLEITSRNFDGVSRHTFDEAGGTIGRHRDNSWVLPHPKVSKMNSTLIRLAQLDASLRTCFWDIDRELMQLPDVEVTYGGKNLVRYRTARVVFAVAAIGDSAIEWRIKPNQLVSVCAPSDIDGALRALRKAHQQAG